jgi:hypothetical protein
MYTYRPLSRILHVSINPLETGARRFVVRVSKHYGLSLSQPSLEFVDVDITGDTKAYLDPKVLKDVNTDWGRECVALLQDFFSSVIRHIQAGERREALELLNHLSEPNETRLGLSRGKAQGKAIGPDLSTDIGNAITTSAAAKSGLLEDLEDTALFIPGISFDMVSDMTTNIIRSQLIKYTADMCAKYPKITLVADTYAGPVWDRHAHKWVVKYDAMPIAGIGPLLLVPKSIVRRKKATFDPGDYLQHHILPELQQREFAANSSLVEVLVNGKRRVTKLSVKRKAGIARPADAPDDAPVRPSKELNLEVTLDRPEILDEYRETKRRGTPPLTHEDLAEVTHSAPPDWDKLLADVLAVPAGRTDATRYHLCIEALLTALFYPALDFMRHEYPLNAGRKRVDITYDNIARSGFFDWVNRVVAAPAHEVYVECKNYAKDVGNPELDQLIGRFSVNRSRVGLMLYRSTADKARIDALCRDAALPQQGFILAIDDEDLAAMVAEREADPDDIRFRFLRQKYAQLV